MPAKKRAVLRATAVVLLSVSLAGCVGAPPPSFYREPEIVPITATQTALKDLPAPEAKIPVAVYDFPDQTGQFKPQENVQTLSRAVSQGGAALLIKALRDAGGGTWFTTLERNGLDDLLKERQIIADMRLRYLGERQVNPQALPPLLFAGILMQGGIVGFDTNTLTGGVGARFLGIGGDTEYRQNTVTVSLRAVSVKTGEVLANVTTSKTLASVALSAGAFKFIDFDELLEVEAGITNNEPGVMALRRVIEKAVYAMVIEGAESGLWAFADRAAGNALITAYNATELGIVATPQSQPRAQPRPQPQSQPRALASADGERRGSIGRDTQERTQRATSRRQASPAPQAARAAGPTQTESTAVAPGTEPTRRVAQRQPVSEPAPQTPRLTASAADREEVEFNWEGGESPRARDEREAAERARAAQRWAARERERAALAEPQPGRPVNGPRFTLSIGEAQAHDRAQTKIDGSSTAPAPSDAAAPAQGQLDSPPATALEPAPAPTIEKPASQTIEPADPASPAISASIEFTERRVGA
ncbi:MAG: CsgG/HfaB family protein [Pseudomonadota bacterium]